MRKLALTIGDPSGIGPEITLKMLKSWDEFKDTQLIIFGSLKTLRETASQLKIDLPQNENISYEAVEAELPGEVAYKSIELAVAAIAAKKADALVTGPISKRNLNAAGHGSLGHTEILEELTKKYFGVTEVRAEMLFVHERFRLMLLTRHIAHKDVAEALSKSGAVARPLKTLISYLRHSCGISEPRIAFLGLNPHSGEVGGDEEEKFFKPVIKAVNAIGGSKLEGPFAADGFFRGFKPQQSGYDAIVAAYHDQGLIPFKLLSGYAAVNVTIGLPFLRTSVSHGTAEDIVGKGIAREDSLIAALHEASKVS